MNPKKTEMSSTPGSDFGMFSFTRLF